MQRNGRQLLSLSLFLLLSWTVWAQNPDYDFTIVAINGQTIDGFQLAPGFGGLCFNDRDEIVFTGPYVISPGTYGSGLFSPHHLVVKGGDEIEGEIVASVGDCALNNAGTLVFGGFLQSGKDALFRKERRAPARRLVVGGQKIDGLELQSVSAFAITDEGQVVFSAYYKCPNRTLQVGIFTPEAVLVTPGRKVDDYLITAIDPMIAPSSRRVYFHAFNANIGEGIFTLHNLLVKTGDVISGYQLIPEGSSAFGYLAASEHGRLAFGATYEYGSGIFTPQSIVATTSGLIPTAAAINDSGQVVYLGANGLVVNQTPLFSFGDSIDGHILNGLHLPASINNRGAVVFVGNFGPDEAIVLATPKH